MKYQWWLIGAVGLLGLPRFSHQLGFFGARPYGIMDEYYYAGILKKANVQVPAWTNEYQLYYLMNWPVPNNTLLDQTPEKSRWSRPDYTNMKTAALLFVDWYKPDDWKGWTYQDVKLERGLFHWMRIWRKND
jgi:hypothetical protein